MQAESCTSFLNVNGKMFIERGGTNTDEQKYITYQTISTNPSARSKSGPSDMDEIRVQFIVYALTSSECNNLANQLRLDLDYSGNCGDIFTYIQGCIWDTCMYETDSENPYIFDAQYTGLYAKHIDFIFRVNPNNYIES